MTITLPRPDLRGLYKGINQKNAKPVVKCDLNGVPIRTYRSVADAAHSLGISHSGIARCCKGKSKSFAGFRWRFVATPLSGLSGEDNQP